MIARQKDQTSYPILFLMVDESDHVTGLTGLTPTAVISKNGGVYAAAAGAVSELGYGVYKLGANANDYDTLGTLAIHVSAAGADPCDILASVVLYDPFEDIAAVLEDTGTTLPAAITAQTTALQGADGDTLETLSDQMDGIATWTATNIAASVTSGSISQVRGDSWSIAITDLTLDSNKIQFAVKLRQRQTDAESVLFIDSDGLQYVNGVAATDSTKASLSYVGTTLTVTVDPSITDDIAVGSYFYGIQSIAAGGTVLEPYGGTFDVKADTVRAVA